MQSFLPAIPRLADTEEILQERDDKSKVQFPTLGMQVVADKGWQRDWLFKFRGVVTINVVVN